MYKKIFVILCIFVCISCKNTHTKYNYVNISTNRIIDINKKVVALTFDDGPTKYTNEILDLLKKYNACATFFIVGNKIDLYTDTLNKMINNGNEIGNHTYSHKWLTKLDNNDLKNEINKTQDILYTKFKYTPTNFRPTYGGINKHVRKNIKLNIIMWNIDTKDWKYKNINTIVSRATKNTKDLDIILMHDTKKRTVEALKIIIPSLKNKGFNFVTVTELQEIIKIRNEK